MEPVSLVVRSANAGDVAGILTVYLDSWLAGYEGLLAQEVLDEEMGRRRPHDWLGDISSETCEVAVAVEADLSRRSSLPALSAISPRSQCST